MQVDHNHGGQDALAYWRTPQGPGIAGATVLAFRKADYDVGDRSARYLVGRTTTDQAGRWRQALELPPGAYVLVFAKPGDAGPDTTIIMV
jgi:hypothetical protein